MPRMRSRDDRVRAAGYEIVDVSTLHQFPGNPRRGDVEAIRESIASNGFVGSLLVQTSTRHVLSGNHTLQALVAEGIDEVPVTWADVDDEEARRIVLAMNRAADLGWYDNDDLVALLDTFGDDDDALMGTLYGSADLDALHAVLSRNDDGDDIGDSHDARTPADRADDHAASAIRSIIIPLSIPEYEETIARLVRLRSAWELESNAEVIVAALRDAESAVESDA